MHCTGYRFSMGGVWLAAFLWACGGSGQGPWPDVANDTGLPDGSPRDLAMPDTAAEMGSTGDPGSDADLPDLRWVSIPGGVFRMGCSPGDDDCWDDEITHDVSISGFSIAATETTQIEYETVMGQYELSWYWDARGCTNDCPAYGLTWFQADEFCRRVGGRLPTEAEWEYAARGGTTTRYYCGDDPACLQQVAHFSLSPDVAEIADRGGYPVGQLQPNAFGLYDMLGGLYEWVHDWYAPDSYREVPPIDPAGPATGERRVMRGGSWATGPRMVRASFRQDLSAEGSANWDVGFRCVRGGAPLETGCDVFCSRATECDTTCLDHSCSDTCRDDPGIDDCAKFATCEEFDDCVCQRTRCAPPTATTGFATGKPLACSSDDLASLVAPFLEDVIAQSPQKALETAADVVSGYRNQEDEPDPQEMLAGIALAALLADSVLPYCWATLTAIDEGSHDPGVLDAAALCLFELDALAVAGAILDCAYVLDPCDTFTLDNLASYFDRTGDIDRAIDAKRRAVEDGRDDNPVDAWDGYTYSRANGRTADAEWFLDRIPSNHPLPLADGKPGQATPVTGACCACTGLWFDDVDECLPACPAGLGCFTGICTPSDQCCKSSPPLLALGFEFCFPPVLLQICAQIDTNATLQITGGLDLVVAEWSAGAEFNFRNKGVTAVVRASPSAGTEMTWNLNTGDVSLAAKHSFRGKWGKFSISAALSTPAVANLARCL